MDHGYEFIENLNILVILPNYSINVLAIDLYCVILQNKSSDVWTY